MNNKNTSLFIGLLIIVMSVWVSPAISAENLEVKPDKALIVFYRVKKGAGAAIPITVHNASGAVGTLSNGASFQKYFDPGEHIFWSKVVVEDTVTIFAEAGNTYYVRGDVKMGFRIGRPKLTQTDVMEAK